MMSLMCALHRGVATENAAADALNEMAFALDGDGRLGEAAAARSIARLHRVRVLEHQATLAGLRVQYVKLLQTDIGA